MSPWYCRLFNASQVVWSPEAFEYGEGIDDVNIEKYGWKKDEIVVYWEGRAGDLCIHSMPKGVVVYAISTGSVLRGKTSYILPLIPVPCLFIVDTRSGIAITTPIYEP
jgi:hypothetical protein